MEISMKDDSESNKKKGLSRRGFIQSVAAGGAALGLDWTLGKQTEARTVQKNTICITVNGRPYELGIGNQAGEVAESQTLVQTLRDVLGLTGTKTCCDRGECGSCTVLLDGKAVLSCSTLTVACEGKEVLTIEGLKDPVTGALHPVQQAFVEHDAIQCGMCTPGLVMSATALLKANQSPTEYEVREGISGNLCRCTGYVKYVEAVQTAARRIRGGGNG
jgi:aerobic-type carbon monoxide dehydrogenase small subunit (CoxS/CutS family)